LNLRDWSSDVCSSDLYLFFEAGSQCDYQQQENGCT